MVKRRIRFYKKHKRNIDIKITKIKQLNKKLKIKEDNMGKTICLETYKKSYEIFNNICKNNKEFVEETKQFISCGDIQKELESWGR